MNRGQAPDPNSLGELEKQAGNARLLQYLGFDAETAKNVAALPEGQRVKALAGEWEKRTDEQKQAGVEMAKQDAENANKIISAPDAPRVEQTPDGKFAVISKNGEDTHVATFDTQEGAQQGLQMALEDHLQNNQDQHSSWEEQMHQAEASAKLGLLEGVPGGEGVLSDQKKEGKTADQLLQEELTKISEPDIEVDDATRKGGLAAGIEAENAIARISSDAKAKGYEIRPLGGSEKSNISPFAVKVAGLFGRRIVEFKKVAGDAPNGIVNKNEPGFIYLDTDSDRPHLLVVGHELSAVLRSRET